MLLTLARLLFLLLPVRAGSQAYFNTYKLKPELHIHRTFILCLKCIWRIYFKFLLKIASQNVKERVCLLATIQI